jgi:MFS family permease
MNTTLSRGGAGLALLLLCAANFLDAMDVATIGVALPAIQAELGLEPTTLQWAVSAYVLGYGGFLLLGGRVADLFGRRRVFLWSLAIFAAASIAGAFVDSGPTLIAARLVKGVSAAFTAPAALALLLSIFDGPARAKALGVFASTGAAGFVMGAVIGGAVTILSWRATLIIGGPIALIVLVASLFVLPADQLLRRVRAAFDWGGALCVTLGLLLLVFGITTASTTGWTDWRTSASLGAAVLLLIAFIIIEKRHSNPMVPLAIFRRAKLTHANIVAASFQGVYVGFQFLATLYYQLVYGWSALATGATFAIGGVCVMVLAPRLAALAQKRGSTLVMVSGTALLALGYIFWFLAQGRVDPLVLVLGSQLLLGLGYAAVYPAVQVAALSDIEADKAGLASGLLFASFQVGGGIVLAATSSVFTAAPGAGWEPYFAGGAFVAAAAVLTMLVATLGPRARRPALATAAAQAAE